MAASCAAFGMGLPLIATGQSPGMATASSVNTQHDCSRVPAGTVLDVELVEPISSETAQLGQEVAMRLASAIQCDGRVLLAAGVPVVAAVTHVESAGRWERPGELVLSGRYLTLARRRFDVRALHLGATGGVEPRSRARRVFGIAASGQDVVFDAGTRASAKLAIDIDPAAIAMVAGAGPGNSP